MIVLWLMFRRASADRRCPAPPEDETEDLVFYRTQASIQRSAFIRILIMVGLSAVVALLWEFTGNRRAIDAQGDHWTRFRLEAGFSAADATVVVVGLLTVAAAISIALVTAVPRDPLERPDDSFIASRLIWAEWTGYALMLSSIFALATALTQ